jgi:predicted RNase H-like HicB family nuclease
MMNESKYEVIVYWDHEDDIFVAEIPEVPGCMAHSASKSDAIENAERAAQLWIKTARDDGINVPEPRGKLMYA